MRRALIFILIIATILPSALADFTAIADAQITLQPCETTTKNITIQNTGDTTATYEISVDGQISDYITFSTINFNLAPTQIQTINVFYQIPCTEKSTTQTAQIYFTDGEIEKEITQEITIDSSIHATTQQPSQTITPCDTAKYQIQLENKLNTTQKYAITTIGYPDIQISEKTPTLSAQQKRNITLTLTPEDCTQTGTYPIEATIKTENAQKSIPLELNINPTDIPNLAEGTTTIRTDYIDSTAELTIQNTGDRTTQYGLSIDGPTWAKISPTTATLEPGQTKTIQLRLTPTEQDKTGNYPLTLTATVTQTGIQYDKEITLKLKPLTAIEKNPAILAAIIAILAALTAGAYYTIKYIRSPKFQAKLQKWKEQRQKRKEQKLKLKQEKQQIKQENIQKQLEQKRKLFEKQQKEKQRLKEQIQAQTEQKIKKEYHLIAKKEIITGTKQKTNPIFKILAILVLLAIIAARNLIIPNLQYALLGAAIVITVILIKKIARLTKITTQYKLLIEGQTKTILMWKKGLTTLSLTATKTIKKLQLKLIKTKTKTPPTQTTYQTFKLMTNLPTDALNYTATIKVPKRWQNKIEDTKLAKYEKNTWKTIPLTKTGEDKKNTYYTAELNKTGTYTIYGKPKQKPKTFKLTYILTGILLITAIAILLSPTKTTGIPTQTWQKDTTHTIKLDNYFKDPDGDKLNYTVTGNNNIKIEIIDGTAYLTPTPNWTGQETIQFTAQDKNNAKTTSNNIILKVENTLIPQKYQIITAILLLIVSILLLIKIATTKQK